MPFPARRLSRCRRRHSLIFLASLVDLALSSTTWTLFSRNSILVGYLPTACGNVLSRSFVRSLVRVLSLSLSPTLLTRSHSSSHALSLARSLSVSLSLSLRLVRFKVNPDIRRFLSSTVLYTPLPLISVGFTNFVTDNVRKPAFRPECTHDTFWGKKTCGKH